MTDRNLNKIVEFLQGLKEQYPDGEPFALSLIHYPDLCRALCATGKYDPFGYKYAEVTQQDRNEKYSLDQRNAKDEFLHEYKD